MSREETLKKLNKAVKLIAKEYDPEKIILYGSYARGDENKCSDIDLMIIKNTKKRPRERSYKISSILFDDSKRFNEFAQLLIEKKIYTPYEYKEALNGGDFFIKNIEKEGKILYAK